MPTFEKALEGNAALLSKLSIVGYSCTKSLFEEINATSFLDKPFSPFKTKNALKIIWTLRQKVRERDLCSSQPFFG